MQQLGGIPCKNLGLIKKMVKTREDWQCWSSTVEKIGCSPVVGDSGNSVLSLHGGYGGRRWVVAKEEGLVENEGREVGENEKRVKR